MKFSRRFALARAVVGLISGTLIVSCSQTPHEPAPEFTLPLSQVTTAAPSPAESAETASAPRRLRYVAVPPGHHVGGMAHARIVLKQKKVARHRTRHHVPKNAVAPAAAVKRPTETAESAPKP